MDPIAIPFRLQAALACAILVWATPPLAFSADQPKPCILPRQADDLVPGLAREPRQPSADDWPQFRGPTGNGVSLATNVPLTWSPTNHVKWKRSVPGRGRSSPGTFWRPNLAHHGSGDQPPDLCCRSGPNAAGRASPDRSSLPGPRHGQATLPLRVVSRGQSTRDKPSQ